MGKMKLLKKTTLISIFIIFIMYLIRTYLILPILVPFAKELGLVNCQGIGLWNSCNYNIIGWVVQFLLIYIIVYIVVYTFSLKKK